MTVIVNVSVCVCVCVCVCVRVCERERERESTQTWEHSHSKSKTAALGETYSLKNKRLHCAHKTLVLGKCENERVWGNSVICAHIDMNLVQCGGTKTAMCFAPTAVFYNTTKTASENRI